MAKFRRMKYSMAEFFFFLGGGGDGGGVAFFIRMHIMSPSLSHSEVYSSSRIMFFMFARSAQCHCVASDLHVQ